MARGKKKQEEKQPELEPTGFKMYGLDEELREVAVQAITHYAEAVEKSKKSTEALGINVSEHKRKLRLLTGSDIQRGLLQIFAAPSVQQQTDLVYDEQVPLDTEIRDALEQIEVTGTDLHLIATLSPEQKRETMQWAKDVAECILNDRDTQPAMPAWIPELFPKVDPVDPLLADIDEGARDEFVTALGRVLGDAQFVARADSDYPTNNELETVIAFRFEEISGKTPAGFLVHRTVGGNDVTCYIAGGVSPFFAYGVQQSTFDLRTSVEEQAVAVAIGERLLGLARKLWGLVDPNEEIEADYEIVYDEQPTGEEITMGSPAATDDAESPVEGEIVDAPAEVRGTDGFDEVETIPAPTREQQEQIDKLKEKVAGPALVQ